MNRAEAAARWRQINRQRLIYYRKYLKAWNAYYLEQGNRIVSNLKDTKTDIYFGVFLVSDIEQLFKKMYEDIGVSFARSTLVEVNINQKAEGDELIYTWERIMADYALIEGSQSIVSISASGLEQAKRLINNITAQGIEQGLSIDQIEDMIEDSIRNEWKIKSKFNARRIARTEVISASNKGAVEGAKSSSVPVKKVWLHSPGKDERTWHADLHLTERDESGYWVTDLGNRMSQPGDKAATAEDVINCRCAVSHVSALR